MRIAECQLFRGGIRLSCRFPNSSFAKVNIVGAFLLIIIRNASFVYSFIFIAGDKVRLSLKLQTRRPFDFYFGWECDAVDFVRRSEAIKTRPNCSRSRVHSHILTMIISVITAILIPMTADTAQSTVCSIPPDAKMVATPAKTAGTLFRTVRCRYFT